MQEQGLEAQWDAFRTLHQWGWIALGELNERILANAHDAGWRTDTPDSILRRMLSNAADFHKACEFGVVILCEYGGRLRPAPPSTLADAAQIAAHTFEPAQGRGIPRPTLSPSAEQAVPNPQPPLRPERSREDD